MNQSDFVIGIQARLGSKRLPGKVLFPLGNSTYNSISLMIRRIRSNPCLKDIPIFVLTSDAECDNAITDFANRIGIKSIRGSEVDVLSRYAELVSITDAPHIIRLTADCPLIDPYEIARLIDLHILERAHYTTNSFPESLTPDGLDVEIISSPALLKSHKDASLPSEREHVTFHIAVNREFKIIRSSMAIADAYIRLTLDTCWDLKLISFIVDALEKVDSATTLEVLDIYYRYNLGKIVSHIDKNAGWKSAFDADMDFMLSKTNNKSQTHDT